jgi:hypothetical protein
MESTNSKVVISRNIIFNESTMLPDNPSTSAPVQRITSVQVERFIDVDSTPDNYNVAIQDAPNVDDSPIVYDPSIVKHSSPVVQPPQHSIANDWPGRGPKPRKRLIEE